MRSSSYLWGSDRTLTALPGQLYHGLPYEVKHGGSPHAKTATSREKAKEEKGEGGGKGRAPSSYDRGTTQRQEASRKQDSALPGRTPGKHGRKSISPAGPPRRLSPPAPPQPPQPPGPGSAPRAQTLTGVQGSPGAPVRRAGPPRDPPPPPAALPSGPGPVQSSPVPSHPLLPPKELHRLPPHRPRRHRPGPRPAPPCACAAERPARWPRRRGGFWEM